MLVWHPVMLHFLAARERKHINHIVSLQVTGASGEYIELAC